jgi:hypothetical protein
MNSIPCPHCQNAIAADPRLSRQNVSCPHCRQVFLMPAIAAAAVPIPIRQEHSDPLGFLSEPSVHVSAQSFSPRTGHLGHLPSRRPPKNYVALSYIIAGGLAVVILGVLAVYMMANSTRVTLPNYQRVETGMTDRQVIEILGPGEEAASSDVNGLGFSASAKVVKWKDGITRIVVVEFVNGRVFAKSQFGL